MTLVAEILDCFRYRIYEYIIIITPRLSRFCDVFFRRVPLPSGLWTTKFDGVARTNFPRDGVSTYIGATKSTARDRREIFFIFYFLRSFATDGR